MSISNDDVEFYSNDSDEEHCDDSHDSDEENSDRKSRMNKISCINLFKNKIRKIWSTYLKKKNKKKTKTFFKLGALKFSSQISEFYLEKV